MTVGTSPTVKRATDNSHRMMPTTRTTTLVEDIVVTLRLASVGHVLLGVSQLSSCWLYGLSMLHMPPAYVPLFRDNIVLHSCGVCS